ncbi:MAG: hypothetical protein ACXVWZ_00935 [Nocardioides sp.]
MTRSTLRALVLALALLLAPTGPAAHAAAGPIEDYPAYQPQTFCSPKAKPGTVYLAHWLVHRYGGGLGGISRPCGSGGTSEHKEGRALDWSLSAGRAADRAAAKAFMERVRRPDSQGNPDAWARRMGIMYWIWADHMYAAWNGYQPEPYLSSGCKTRQRCSTTLRHRDHLHVSLTRRGGTGLTSWYAGRVDQG